MLTRYSEKARIPAWTDRILKKGTNLRQNLYNSAPLQFSDHRPVYATFDCKVNIVDEPRREAISQELYKKRKADIGDAGAHAAEGDTTDDEDLIGYDAIESGLPPTSSDRQKWWLDNRQPARAQIPIPKGRDGQQMVLNPDRSSNPFGQSEEPDWVAVRRSTSQQSFTSLSSSPYEKVSIPSFRAQPASSGGPRKLPPPMEPARLNARVGRTSFDSDISTSRSQGTSSGAPPAPPPRRQTGFGQSPPTQQPLAPLRPESAASSRSSQVSHARSGNGPPPVARKPAHLTGSSPITSPSRTGGGSGGLDGQRDYQPALPARSSTVKSLDSGPGRKAVGMGSMGGVGLPGMGSTSGGQRPNLPSRKAVPVPGSGPGVIRPLEQQHQRAGRGQMDLLGSLDEGGQSMGEWETLQPITKR